MSRRNRLVSMTVALTAALVIAQSTVKGQQTRVSVPSSVRTAAAQGDAVRIIVGVRLDTYQPEGLLGTAAATSQQAAIQEVSARVLNRLPSAASERARTFDFIPYFSTEVDANTLLQLEVDPDVVSIEEDRLNDPTLAQSVPLIGGNSAWASGYSGAGTTVAILDTGVDTAHSFFTGRIVSEACYSNGGVAGSASLCPGSAASSVASGSGINCNTTTVSSSCFHGTHVAGIAAGRGASFSGVARDASIMAFQVFTNFGAGSVRAYNSDIIAGLNRVYALRGSYTIAAVNLSLGSDSFSTQASCDAANGSFKAAIDTLRSVNIATVIASGNDGFATSMSAPGCVSTAISVGSTTKTDAVSSFSNAAPFLSLLAPGSSINSAMPGNAFGLASGTSMATPHVAGAWAVLKQRSPFATVTGILNALRSTGALITDTRNGVVFPRIRVDAALAALPTPLLTIDTPSPGAFRIAPFVVNGWAIDRNAIVGSGIDAVHVYAVPSGGGAAVFLGVASYGGARSDVGAAFGSQYTNSAFSLTVPSLANGSYTIQAFGHSTVSGTFNISTSVPLTVGPAPAMSVDAPASNGTFAQRVTVSGWAIDRAAPTGSGVDAVHVWAFPSGGGAAVFLGAAAYGLTRPDVGSLFGSQFTNAGYLLQADLSPGTYNVNVYMHSTVTGTFNAVLSATNVTVTAPPPNPLLSIDTPTNGSSRSLPFVISGWAADTAASSGAGMDTVHIWAFPTNGAPQVFVGVATYGIARPDVAAVLGDSRFTNSGYSLTVGGGALSPGTYDLYVFGHSTYTASFSIVRVVRVTVS